MRYNQPYGISDENAPYINGDPSVGRAGSIPPAASIEYPQREIVGFITDSGLEPINEDLRQLSKAVQSGKVLYGIDTGTANAMVAALNPPVVTLTPGLTVRVKKIGSKNTGPATIDVGTGANLIKRASGASLNDNDLPAGIICELIWDGAVWQIANFQGTGIAETVNNYTVNIPYAVDSGTVNALVASFTPALPGLTAGMLVLVKAANKNTGPTTLTITGGIGTKSVARPDGTPLQTGDLPLGAVGEFIYDGVKWQLNGDLSINNLNIYEITNAPFADVPYFQGTGTVTLPYYTKLVTPFTSMIGGGAGNVELSGGGIRIKVSGRYQFLGGVVIQGQNGNEPFQGLRSGHLFVNGAIRQVGCGFQGGAVIKEVYGAVCAIFDLVVGDVVTFTADQVTQTMVTYNCLYQCNCTVARVR